MVNMCWFGWPMVKDEGCDLVRLMTWEEYYLGWDYRDRKDYND